MRTSYSPFRGAATTPVGVRYFPLQEGSALANNGGDASATPEHCSLVPPGGCDVVELVASSRYSMTGSGDTIDLTIMVSTDDGVSWSATAATVQIADTDAADSVHRWTGSVAVAAGDLISLEVDRNQGTSQDRTSCAVVLSRSDGGQIMFGGGQPGSTYLANTDHAFNFHRSSSLAYYGVRPAISGTFKNFAALMLEGDGEWSFGVRQANPWAVNGGVDLTVDTLLVTSSAPYDSDATVEVHVGGDEIGSTIYYRVVEEVAETVGMVSRTSVVFFPDRAGHSIHHNYGGVSSGVRYISPQAGINAGLSSYQEQRVPMTGDGWREIGYVSIFTRSVSSTALDTMPVEIRSGTGSTATTLLDIGDITDSLEQHTLRAGLYSTSQGLSPTEDAHWALYYDKTSMTTNLVGMFFSWVEVDTDATNEPTGTNTLDDDCKNQWEFDEASGTRVDEKSANDFAVRSTFADPGRTTSAVINGGVLFDRSVTVPHECLDAGASTDYNDPASGEVQFSGFVALTQVPQGVSATQRFWHIAESSGSGHSFKLEFLADEVPLYWRVVGAVDAKFYPNGWDSGTYYFVEISIVEGGDVVLWVNRTWKTVVDAPVAINYRDRSLYCGSYDVGGVLDGTLDHWACHTAVKSDADMIEACNALSGLAFASWDATAVGGGSPHWYSIW